MTKLPGEMLADDAQVARWQRASADAQVARWQPEQVWEGPYGPTAIVAKTESTSDFESTLVCSVVLCPLKENSVA